MALTHYDYITFVCNYPFCALLDNFIKEIFVALGWCVLLDRTSSSRSSGNGQLYYYNRGREGEDWEIISEVNLLTTY